MRWGRPTLGARVQFRRYRAQLVIISCSGDADWRARAVKSFTTAIPLSERQPDRCAKETVLLANAVLEKAHISEVHQVGVINMEQESWRIGPHLGCKKDIESLSFPGRRWMCGERSLQEPVHLAGRDPSQTLFLNPQGARQDLMHPLTGLG